MANLDEFVKANKGKAIDVDGAFGPQCWDLTELWVRACGAGTMNTQGGPNPGYAEGAWYAPQSGLQKVTSNPQPGDLVVWRWGLSAMPLSHTAIYLGKGNLGTLKTFSQNSPQPYAAIQSFSPFGVLGYLRPSGVTGSGEVDGSIVGDKIRDANPFAGLDISGVTALTDALQSKEFWVRAGLILLGVFLLILAVLTALNKSDIEVPDISSLKEVS